MSSLKATSTSLVSIFAEAARAIHFDAEYGNYSGGLIRCGCALSGLRY